MRNIDRIIRLSRYPVMSYELAVNGGKLDEIKQGLLQVASKRRIRYSSSAFKSEPKKLNV